MVKSLRSIFKSYQMMEESLVISLLVFFIFSSSLQEGWFFTEWNSKFLKLLLSNHVKPLHIILGKAVSTMIVKTKLFLPMLLALTLFYAKLNIAKIVLTLTILWLVSISFFSAGLTLRLLIDKSLTKLFIDFYILTCVVQAVSNFKQWFLLNPLTYFIELSRSLFANANTLPTITSITGITIFTTLTTITSTKLLNHKAMDKLLYV